MTSFNINDNILIKEEHDIASHSKVIQLFSDVKCNNTIKHESNVLPPPVNNGKIKKEEIDEVTEFVESTRDVNKPLQDDGQYKDPSICDGVQVKQETNNTVDVKPTTAVCNNVLNHVKLEQTDNVETTVEHFIGECDYCNKIFSCRLSLMTHINNHIIQESCKTCYVVLHRIKNFSNRIKNINNIEGKSSNIHPHVCSVCNKYFKYSCQLKRHERTHTYERPYICNVCNKRFTLSYKLRLHKRTHTNDRPYTCNLCNKTFKRTNHLRDHERIHMNERPYICNVCNKQFTQRCNLKTHERTHTNERPYVCNLCNKRFTHISSLREHERRHTNERLYACNVCNKRLTRKSNLKVHERIHTNERPYICIVCDKRFIRSTDLRKHVLIHREETRNLCDIDRQC